MLLADAGADVLRVDRHRRAVDGGALVRGRPRLELDLKTASGLATARSLARAADVVIEGYRPGVMERLGLGPRECLADNPRLVYGRMTGWGQAGPRARQPGHDINYLGLTGALRSIARLGHAPVPPLNLVADYGGGGMMLAFGIVTALVERSTSGRGQVVDAAMVDGVSLLMTGVWSRAAQGRWPGEPGANDLDSGAPFYDVYATCDGEYMTPVLSMSEAALDPHLSERGTLVDVDGATSPAPAPRLSRTPFALRAPDSAAAVLRRWRVSSPDGSGRGEGKP
jgi:alpha-methylacyl-CoA racemase